VSVREEEAKLDRGRQKARTVVKVPAKHKAAARQTSSRNRFADVLMMAVVVVVILAALCCGYYFSRRKQGGQQEKTQPSRQNRSVNATPKNPRAADTVHGR
jgi:uncharacterized protein HemX